MKRILESIKEGIAQLLGNTLLLKEIKYFHPSGRSLPNGSHYQKGHFLRECDLNRKAFFIPETSLKKDPLQRPAKGGILVFSNTCIDILNRLNFIFLRNPETRVYSYSVGTFFKGEFVSSNGDIFDKESLCIHFSGIGNNELGRLCRILHQESPQTSLLLKNLQDSRIYVLIRKN